MTAEDELAKERWQTHREKHADEKEARELAFNEINRRLEELNKLREEVVQDRSQFVHSETYDADLKAIKVEMRTKDEAQSARTDALEKIIDRAEGSINTWRGIAAFLGLGGVAAIIYAITNAPK